MFGANRAPTLLQDYHNLETDSVELPLEPHNLEIPTGVSKMISEPTVCLAQTVHLSCVKIATISKRTESSFHLNLVT
jgi:hypothetical protein